jgi:hypothetical protein
MIDDPTMPAPTDPTTIPPVGNAPAPKKKIAPKKKVKDRPGMRLDTRGTVTIQELCADLKINCTSARRTLRDNAIEKSLYGNYEWDKGSPEYKRVRKLLTA